MGPGVSGPTGWEGVRPGGTGLHISGTKKEKEHLFHIIPPAKGANGLSLHPLSPGSPWIICLAHRLATAVETFCCPLALYFCESGFLAVHYSLSVHLRTRLPVWGRDKTDTLGFLLHTICCNRCDACKNPPTPLLRPFVASHRLATRSADLPVCPTRPAILGYPCTLAQHATLLLFTA